MGRKPELDAFLVTAFSPELRDDAFLDELVLENVTIRGVRLSMLFMQGIEMAMFANDACGAPIPFQMCFPGCSSTESFSTRTSPGQQGAKCPRSVWGTHRYRSPGGADAISNNGRSRLLPPARGTAWTG